VENGIVSEEKQKPVFDEQTLAKLLEAAFVLQEHNREVRELELNLDLKREKIEAEEIAKSASTREAAKASDVQAAQGDYTFTLAQIVATQHQIQIRNLEMEKALALVTERVVEIARSAGAAIGIVDGKKVQYRAVAGSRSPKLGTVVPAEKALCLPCVKNGQVFRCADVNPEFLIDVQECRRRGIQSLIAVPIFHEGGVAGGLELYYSNPNGFTDQDVHTCQLMAGLVTEALARDEEHTWKQSLADERAAMLQAIEKLRPSVTALTGAEPAKPVVPAPTTREPAIPSYVCLKCGHNLGSGEQFCGQCGSPRGGVKNTVPPLPVGPPESKNKEISAEASKLTIVPVEEPESIVPAVHALPQAPLPQSPPPPHSADDQFHDLFAEPKPSFEETPDVGEMAAPTQELSAEHKSEEEMGEETAESDDQDKDAEKEPTGLATLTHPADWSSAANAREFLEQLAPTQRSALARFWETRRGDIYLAIAVVLVICVVRWGIWSNHQVNATSTPPAGAAAAHHKEKAPDADLSMLDRLLISLGLAEAPEPPEDRGNPTVKVWVDLKTALYYCPGSDLYGKTPKGKFTTQRDAQLDQYEPAYRKTCE
jgi:hypothetical protein